MAKANPTMELIKAISARSGTQFGYGIGMASGYLEALKSCMGDQQCSKLLEGIDNDVFEASLKSAKTRLTFAEEECWEKGGKYDTNSSSMAEILNEIEGNDGSMTLPKHCAMVFRNIVTTNKMDRDRDILDPMGAQVDKSMPLLWQHLQPMPIGKLLGTIEQNNQFLKVASCICDVNDLASDSIKMVEAGILRISHGFKPKSFEMLASEPGSQLPAGFMVKQYEVVEESLVSVPANSGAIIDAWASLVSKKSLKTQVVKNLGESLWHLRDTAGMVSMSGVKKIGCTCNTKASGDITGAAADLTASPNPGISTDAERSDNKKDQTEELAKAIQALDASKDISEAKIKLIERAKELGQESLIPASWTAPAKSFAELQVKNLTVDTKLYSTIEGSYEWISNTLSAKLRGYMKTGKIPFDDDYQYAYIEATMPGSAIVSVSAPRGGGTQTFWSVPYSVSENGVEFGDAEPVQVQAAAVIRPMKDGGAYRVKSMLASAKSMDDLGMLVANVQKMLKDEDDTVESVCKRLAITLLSVDHSDESSLSGLDSIVKLASTALKQLVSERDEAQFAKELGLV